ncbi:MAG: hypothetical protein EOP50_00145 [Sphingobacteriales bacterium]|nr:MAG: hypothetical protein EOP50_00145 [Sphingobacteriales bacterium]
MKKANGNGQNNGQSNGNGSTTATAVIKTHPAAGAAGTGSNAAQEKDKAPEPPAPEKPKDPAPDASLLPAKLDLPPLEDRLHKVEELYELVGRLEGLNETKRKLQAFKVSTDGHRDRLTLADARGNEFVTSNSAVISEVLDLCRTVIDRKIEETAAAIRF